MVTCRGRRLREHRESRESLGVGQSRDAGERRPMEPGSFAGWNKRSEVPAELVPDVLSVDPLPELRGAWSGHTVMPAENHSL